MEGIPYLGAKVYSLFARKSPLLRDLYKEVAEEVNAQVRRKYGWFLSFFFLNIVRAHSSMTLRKVEEILSSSEIGFSKRSVDDKGVIFKLRLFEVGIGKCYKLRYVLNRNFT